ncbi:MAG: DUF4304 domain-containing protein [Capnocytophaga sp.]|nr:DUF4304 domain-containing protein [Capnocytophaga sp.]
MKTKTQTQEFFDDIVKDIHQLLKDNGFKKKALNFYRCQNGFEHFINIQKSAYNSADCIRFTLNVCVDVLGQTPRSTMYDFAIRQRVGFIDGDTDVWYDLDGEISDIFKRKQVFAEEKQAVLHDIAHIVLPFFERMNTAEKIANF